jgi:uncharacterized protein DUF4054
VGGCGNWPNYNAMLQNIWGAGQEFWSSGFLGAIQGASNFTYGQNPPYYLDNFLAFYPKFFGLPMTVANCTTVIGTNVVAVPSVNGLQYGQFFQSAAFPSGSVITGITSGTTITVNNNALSSTGTAVLSVYQSPPIPTTVIQLYINLANASLVQARWCEQWLIAMAWFVAHYLTLWAQTDASEVLSILQAATHGEEPASTLTVGVYALSSVPPGGVLQTLTNNGVFMSPGVDYTLTGAQITINNPQPGDSLYATWQIQVETFTNQQPNGAQIAAQGLAGGIQTSKGVGDVSVSYQPLSSLEDWGQWNLTKYGQQLSTMAKVIGSGPAFIW